MPAKPQHSGADLEPYRIDSRDKQNLRRRLFAWYEKNARDLPWRRSRDPYRVWVSEIMLQQTQVETVKAYFQRFIKEFPTVRHLACAQEQQVLRLWEGLGYYRRARQLHAAAQVIEQEHAGTFPTDFDSVIALPGIGRYTAGAILSIAFDARQPILEANTIRLFSRLIAYRDIPTNAAGQKTLWATATDILPRKRVGEFNQALMELGSKVCTPKNPLCTACPLRSLCAAHATGNQDEIPRADAKVDFEHVTHTAVIVQRNRRFLVLQRRAGEHWEGLWDFPRFPVEQHSGKRLHQEIHSKVAQQAGVEVQLGEQFSTMKHGVTKYRITLKCFKAIFKGTVAGSDNLPQMQWATLSHLEQLPLNSTGRKIVKQLQKET